MSMDASAGFRKMMPEMAQRLAARERPQGRVVGYQRWTDLLFAHWEVDPALVQTTLPPGLFADMFHGRAFVGIVPFFMERVRPAWLPSFPWISWFMELNVRTYVHDENGEPGVWFHSLDCNQPVAVALARRVFHLPYFHARMTARRPGDRITYQCARRCGDAAESRFEWSRAHHGTVAQPGSLDFFLTERYRLFAKDSEGALHSGRVHHARMSCTPPR